MTTIEATTDTGGVGPDGEDDNNLVDLPSCSEQGNSSSVEGEDFVLDLGTIGAPKRDPKRNAQAKTNQRIQRKAAPDANQSKRSVVVLPRTQTVPVLLVSVFFVFLATSVLDFYSAVVVPWKFTAFWSGSFLTGSYDLFPRGLVSQSDTEQTL